MITPERKLELRRKALEQLRERIQSDSYMSVKDVQERLSMSREKVEGLPEEILPYVDLGSGSRMMRRYHPADVYAVDARLRGWRRAQQDGRGEEYLGELREELEERDRVIQERAREMTREVA